MINVTQLIRFKILISSKEPMSPQKKIDRKYTIRVLNHAYSFITDMKGIQDKMSEKIDCN